MAARWTEPDRREGALSAYAREAEARSLELLDGALERPSTARPSETVEQRLRAAAPADVAELRAHLQQRADEEASRAAEQLAARGASESRRLREILEAQRARVRAELERYEGHFEQLAFGFLERMAVHARGRRPRLARLELDPPSTGSRSRYGSIDLGPGLRAATNVLATARTVAAGADGSYRPACHG